MMLEFQKDFADFEGKIWLNAASEGPIPQCAISALQEATVWKSKPFLLDTPTFARIPAELKSKIAELVNVEANDVILGNSASYGLHQIANGFPWKSGDEILVMRNDFPTDIWPWLGLMKKGVVVKQITAKDKVLTPSELRAHITPKTKLFCIAHVHSFTGYVLDVSGFGKICHEHGITFVVNLSQSAGAMPISVHDLGADAVVAAGYKWLLGPYGTGFSWMKKELREKLEYNQSYWIPMSTDGNLTKDEEIKWRDVRTSRKFDVFGTANFFNFVPWTASIDYLMNIGLGHVKKHNDQLVEYFLHNYDRQMFDLISPKDLPARSGLIVISHKDKNQNEDLYKALLVRGIFTAFWKGNIRIAPHIYNTISDLQKLLESLSASSK